MSLCSSLWPPVILLAERRFPTRWISPDSPGQSTNKPTPHRKRASSIMLRCKSWCYLRGSALSLMRSEPTPLHDGLGGQHLLEDSYLFVEERYSSCCSVELSTSWTVMRPAEPVPSTIERSTPSSFALRVAAGVAFTSLFDSTSSSATLASLSVRVSADVIEFGSTQLQSETSGGSVGSSTILKRNP